MGRTLGEKLEDLEPKRRVKIEDEAQQLLSEYRTLKELRQARKLTQTELAERLGVRQATIAQLEKRSDLLLSTLRGYVESLGGKLDLVVQFPGQAPLTLSKFEDLDMKSTLNRR